jgi:hypothetical protein
MKTIGSVDEAVEAIGAELGVSRWVEVNQPRIDQFADVTGDHQSIGEASRRRGSDCAVRVLMRGAGVAR